MVDDRVTNSGDYDADLLRNVAGSFFWGDTTQRSIYPKWGSNVRLKY